jgi:hypothetical protein
MKNWFERIATSIALVGGYALMAAIYLVVLTLLGYGIIELVTRTIYEPSLLLYVADFLVSALSLFVITRRGLRIGLKELWRQLTRNNM